MDNDLPDTVVTTRPKQREQTNTRRLPPYHVVLENDDYHSFEFVVETLQKTFGYAPQKALLLTNEAHTQGRAVVWTGPKEVAELKLEQLLSFHEVRADGRKFGPLGCTIEPAPGA
jgi:ATP-dependent Clp protease adaptor protein ClpS